MKGESERIPSSHASVSSSSLISGNSAVSNNPSSSMMNNPPILNNYTEDDIRQRAYQIFLDRGGIDGNDLDDWLRAEAELQAESELQNPTEQRTEARRRLREIAQSTAA